jgi:hypothetical protein
MGIKFNPLSFSGIDFTGSGSVLAVGTPVGGADNNAVLVTDGAGLLADKVLTTGQLLIGSTGAAPVAAQLQGTTSQVNVTNAAGSITLSLPQSIATTSSPTFANINLRPSGTLDTTSAGTIAIGTGNANVINIGNSGATINIQGTTFYQNVSQLQVTDKLITINKGGSTGSASNSGIEIEENSIITAYVDTTGDRTGWEFKAPSTAGVVTITPGVSGFTINQGSHNPVTLATIGATPNTSGASLSSQVLTLQPADATNPGLVTAGVQTFGGNKTFSGTISATNLSGTNTGDQTITLTGDIAGSGTGSFATTLATVNTNVGSFGSGSSVSTFTVNGKGLITAAATTSISIAASQVTSGLLAVARGGTGVDGSAAANGSLLIGNGSGFTVSTITAGTGITVTNATGAITVTNQNAAPFDIGPTTWSGLLNNTANQDITGFSLNSAVSSFSALVSLAATATTDLHTTMKLVGIKTGADWSFNQISTELVGSTVPSLAFSISSLGQVRITIGTVSGFTAGSLKFRVSTLS